MPGFLDNFAVEGLTIIGNKILESSNNLKNVENNHNHNIYFTKNGRSIIIISSLLFGSIYLTSVSMKGLNDMIIHGKKENYLWFPFLWLNGSILLGSSVLFLTCTGYLLEDN